MFCFRKIIIRKNIYRYFTACLLCLFIMTVSLYFGCAGKKGSSHREWRKDSGLATSGQYRSVVMSDLDNDGNIDIVGGGSSPGTVGIWYGDGSGRTTTPYFLPFKGDVRSVATGDINEDGLNDIVLSAGRESVGLIVWENLPGRKWRRIQSPAKTRKYEGVKIADVNGDGHADIIAANATLDVQGGIQVWFGDGNGNWPVESGPTVEGIFMDVAVGDFDEDGFQDLAGAGWGTYGALRIWNGDGSGSWSAIPPVGEGCSYYGLTAEDINNDGHLDILAGTYREGGRIFLGDGKGGFKMAHSPVDKGSVWLLFPVELDGDGKKDLLASSNNSRGITAWRNKGLNSWGRIKGRFPSVGTYYGIMSADINNDGVNDICAASFGEGIKLWLGSGELPPETEAEKEKKLFAENPVVDEIEENKVYTAISGIPEYKIGPGDVLEFTIWRGSTGTKELVTVRPDGKISFELVEDFDVNGLTPVQLDKLFTEKMKQYIKRPRIDIVVEEFNSKFVTLMGAWSNVKGVGQGRYELKGKVTVLEMLADRGGLPRDANLSDVRLRRKNGQAFTLDLYRAITHGDTDQNMVLDDGDLVFIPALTSETNRVYVFGEVAKPGVYTFTGSDMRLFDAVSQAGGVTVFASEESTKVVRGDIARPEVVSADLENLIENGDQTQNISLANGDLIYVPRSAIGDVNLFVKRITPLLKLIYLPGRVATDINSWESVHE